MRDRDHVLHAYLEALVDLCDARVGGLYSIELDSPRLVAQVHIDQAALDHVALAWRTDRAALHAAHAIVACPPGAIVALHHQAGLVGLLYLDRLPQPLTPWQRQTVELLRDVLGQTRRAADGPVIARHDPLELRREQLLQALRRTAGNVTAAARLLGISRQTFYEHAAVAGINPVQFRV